MDYRILLKQNKQTYAIKNNTLIAGYRLRMSRGHFSSHISQIRSPCEPCPWPMLSTNSPKCTLSSFLSSRSLQTDRLTGIQTDRHTDRSTDRQTQTDGKVISIAERLGYYTTFAKNRNVILVCVGTISSSSSSIYYAPARRKGGSKRWLCPSVRRVHSE